MERLNLTELINYYIQSETVRIKNDLEKKDWLNVLFISIYGPEQMKGKPEYKISFGVAGNPRKPNSPDSFYSEDIKEVYVPKGDDQAIEVLKSLIRLVMSRSKTKEISNLLGADFYISGGSEMLMHIEITLLNNIVISLPLNDLAFLDIVSEACENHYMPQNIDPRVIEFLKEQKNNSSTP